MDIDRYIYIDTAMSCFSMCAYRLRTIRVNSININMSTHRYTCMYSLIEYIYIYLCILWKAARWSGLANCISLFACGNSGRLRLTRYTYVCLYIYMCVCVYIYIYKCISIYKSCISLFACNQSGNLGSTRHMCLLK